MKFFIFICFLAAVASVIGQEFIKKSPEEIGQYRDECEDEFDLSPELRSYVQNFEYPEVEPILNYLRCVCEKVGHWDSNNGFSIELLVEQFGEEIRSIAETCVTERNPELTVEQWLLIDWQCMTDGGLKPEVIEEEED